MYIPYINLIKAAASRHVDLKVRRKPYKGRGWPKALNTYIIALNKQIEYIVAIIVHTKPLYTTLKYVSQIYYIHNLYIIHRGHSIVEARPRILLVFYALGGVTKGAPCLAARLPRDCIYYFGGFDRFK